MARALVLHSGGIDSSTCLAIAARDYDEVTALSIHYGQRHSREIDAARDVAKHLCVQHEALQLPPIENSMLTDASREIPSISYEDIKGISPTYVPFRNGLLLANVASLAQAREFDAIFFGAHAEDAHNWAYPDCTPEFIGAMANAIFIGTYQKVRLVTPLEWLNKQEIITLGDKLGVPWGKTWSCYKGEPVHCGVCPTCRARRAGFIAAGIFDPTVYGATP